MPACLDYDGVPVAGEGGGLADTQVIIIDILDLGPVHHMASIKPRIVSTWLVDVDVWWRRSLREASSIGI
ncbi:hypothetical protein IMZ48_33140 [Candidatus Bathyarchaeota archaeon]|nr:hypothetical protein [Candidatus Bathyarchaeota archaeon]